MASLTYLRQLINGRLTAAAEDIFTHVERVIVEYEAELTRQRKLLEIVCKPRLKLQRIELPQQHVCYDEEVQTDQQLWNHKRNSSLDQEEPESLQIKEEEEDICTSWEQLEPKEEADTVVLTPDDEESDHMGPDADHQLLSAVAESQYQTVHMRNITNPPQQYVYNEEVFSLWNQEWNSSLDQEEPESLQIIEDKEEISQEQLEPKEEADTFMLTPDNEESDHMEPDTDHQLLSAVAQSQDQTVHISNITGEKPHMCNFCKKCFRWKNSLIRHVRIHTGEKPHMCDICNKCFTYTHSLKSHMVAHTGLKPHACDICNKCFVHKSSLIYHMRNHAGGKPYVCDICNKCFVHRPSFVYHMRTHTGEKPHMCSICEKCFVYKSSLMNHMRTHTAEKPYTTAAPAHHNLVT